MSRVPAAAKDYDRVLQIHGYMALGEAKSIREKFLLRKTSCG
jgi:hypothetical protein